MRLGRAPETTSPQAPSPYKIALMNFNHILQLKWLWRIECNEKVFFIRQSWNLKVLFNINLSPLSFRVNVRKGPNVPSLNKKSIKSILGLSLTFSKNVRDGREPRP